MQRYLLPGLLLSLVLLTGCGQTTSAPQKTNPETNQAQLANPASVYCEEQGGKLNLADGMCTLPDGTQCEEWAYFRHECPASASGSIIPTASGATANTGLANPASTNCVKLGGQVQIKDSPAGQYGVCLFEDNRQCEEWALMRGECPVGGRKITGYTTEAASFCAISGGEYTMTQAATQTDGSDEQGNCKLPGGKECDAGEYFSGQCH